MTKGTKTSQQQEDKVGVIKIKIQQRKTGNNSVLEMAIESQQLI